MRYPHGKPKNVSSAWPLSVIEIFWKVDYPKYTTKAPQNYKANNYNANYTFSTASILEMSQIYEIVMLYFNVI